MNHPAACQFCSWTNLLDHQFLWTSSFRNIKNIQNSLITVSLTARACWIKVLLDLMSAYLPSGINFFPDAWDRSIQKHLASSEPRMYFLPKNEISTRGLFFWIMMPMGKVEQCRSHSEMNPTVTLLIMFCAWLQIVPKVASSFLFLQGFVSSEPFFFFWRRLFVFLSKDLVLGQKSLQQLYVAIAYL